MSTGIFFEDIETYFKR